MDIMEIVLLAAGGIVFILSFLIPMKKEESSGETRGLAKEEIKTLVSEELEAVRGHVDDVVEEAVNYSIEKTERSLERLSNEKIMAVNEYSDTVLAEIHKNHEEVMFLYDMLNDKHANLKNTVSEINRTMKEAKETKKEAEEVVNTFQRLSPEAVLPLNANKINLQQTPAAVQKSAVAQQSMMLPPQSSVMTPKPVPRQPVMEQNPAKVEMKPLVQKPVMAKPLVTMAVQESVISSAPTIGREPVTPATPVMTQEPVIPATPVMTQEPVIPTAPVMTQEPVIPMTPVMPQKPVMPVASVIEQEPVMPVASVVEQESVMPVAPMTQEPIMPTAPIMPQEPAVTTQEITAVLPQAFVAPQVFATAPTPVTVQMPVVPQPLAGAVPVSESPLPPDAISFTQETDIQGRNYNELIMEMYQNGKSNVAIARELNLGVGEVKLVIDLYKNRSER